MRRHLTLALLALTAHHAHAAKPPRPPANQHQRAPAAAPANVAAAPATALANVAAAPATALATATPTNTPSQWRWLDGRGRQLPFEDIVEQIHSRLDAPAEAHQAVEVHVGADSALHGDDRVVFAIAVCLYSVGNAGRYYYTRFEQQRSHFPVLQTRLLREVELALDAAQKLTSEGIDIESVHCDSNTVPGCKSTEHTAMLSGYIKSMGYTCRVKPEAWANLVADRHSRGARTMAP